MESIYLLDQEVVKRLTAISFNKMRYKVITEVCKSENNNNKKIIYSLYRGTQKKSEAMFIEYFKNKKLDKSSFEDFFVVPNHFIKLVHIETFNAKERGLGYGSLLLNFAIADINCYSKNIDKNLSLLLNSFGTDEAISFYNSFNAKVNNKSAIIGLVPMIIEYPKIKQTHTFKKITERYFLLSDAQKSM